MKCRRRTWLTRPSSRTRYKWYRISMTDDERPTDVSPGEPAPPAPESTAPLIPGWRGDPGEKIKFLWQILPIEDEQVEGWFDKTNTFQRFPAFVFGEYAAG